MKSVLLLLGFLHFHAESSQCNLGAYCRAMSHEIMSLVALSTEPSVVITCASVPTSWRVTPVNTNGVAITLGEAMELPVGLSSSFVQDGASLTVSNVNGSYEGIYSCHNNTENLQLIVGTCVFVQGRALFSSCMDDCSQTEIIDGVINGNVILDTRVTFSDGGVCENEPIRLLRITRLGSTIYTCTNITPAQSNSPCSNDGSVVVVPNEPMAHKYDFRIVLMNVGAVNEGLYTVEVVRANGEQSIFSKTIDVRLRNPTSVGVTSTTSVTTGGTSTTSVTTTSITVTTNSEPVRGVNGGLIAGCLFGVLVIISLSLILIIAIPVLLYRNKCYDKFSLTRTVIIEEEVLPHDYVNVDTVITSPLTDAPEEQQAEKQAEKGQAEKGQAEQVFSFSFSDHTLNSHIEAI